MAVHYKPHIVTDGMVLYLDAGNIKSYPRSGTDWYDLSGNEYNGTLVNSPTFDDNTITLNGSNYIQHPDNSLFYNLTAMTISLWVKLNSMNQNQPLVTKWDFQSQGTFTFQTSQLFDGGLTSFIATIVTDGGTGCRLDSQPNILFLSTWYNIVYRYDASETGNLNRFRIYLNNNQIELTQGVGNVPDSLTIGTAPLRFGFLNGLSWYAIATYSNMSIYNRALSSSEISQNYNATKGRFGY